MKEGISNKDEDSTCHVVDVCLNRKLVLILLVVVLCWQVYLYAMQSRAIKVAAISSLSQTTATSVKLVDIDQTRKTVSIGSIIAQPTADLLDGRTVVNGHETIPKRRVPKHLLTICTTWVSHPDKYELHNNTLLNWQSLNPILLPVLFTDDAVLANSSKLHGWYVLPYSKTATSRRTPILKYMMIEIMRLFESEFYGYANSDILFTSSIWETLTAVRYSEYGGADRPVLIVGRRTNVANIVPEEARSHSSLTSTALSRGELFIEWAVDYFLTSPVYPWKDIPEVIIGTLGYDNWLILNAVEREIPVVDATHTLLAVHQTSQGGNWESFNTPDQAYLNYNKDLLAKYFNASIPYHRGRIDCTTHATHWSNDSIHVNTKEVAQICHV